MNDLEKLNKAIATARRVHESIAEGRNGDIVRGAMLEALETIAKLLPQAQKAQDPVCQPEPLSVAYKFDSELVDRLAQAAWTFDVRNDGLPWKLVNDAAKDNVRGHVLATLTELAKAPVELPSADELPAIYWRGQKRAGHESCDNLSGAGIGAVLEYIGAHIAPAIAARDAEIARLREVGATLGQTIATLTTENERLTRSISAVLSAKEANDANWRARAGELERQVDTEKEKRRMTIESAKGAKKACEERISELENLLEQQETEISQLRTLTETSESARRIEGLETRERYHKERIADLEKRLADQTPVDASGKTPGEVFVAAYDVAYARGTSHNAAVDRAREAGAQAVIRAFGGEALRSIRRFVDTTSIPWGDGAVIRSADVIAKIDAELAKLGVNNG